MHAAGGIDGSDEFVAGLAAGSAAGAAGTRGTVACGPDTELKDAAVPSPNAAAAAGSLAGGAGTIAGAGGKPGVVAGDAAAAEMKREIDRQIHR